jgi:O-acetyl-ADP-ribose deacetylase (regulator of RNase III)
LCSLSKNILPWPWNVDIPPFPAHWKDPKNKLNPSPFSLAGIKLQGEENNWRQSQNKFQEKNNQSLNENITLPNRCACLQEIYDNHREKMCSINYVQGDVLHYLHNGASLVHCIGRDAKMGKGFALKVNALFKCKNDIRNQGKEVGEVATIQLGDRQYLFNLITKPFSSIPPDNSDGLLDCLMELRDLCDNLGVKHLSMPRIGTGLDQMPWRLVQNMLQTVFGESNIKIDVYTLPLTTRNDDSIECGRRLLTTNGSMGECPPGKCNKDGQPSTTPRRPNFEASSLPVADGKLPNF